MDIKRCFDILEVNPGASPNELKQAYKDIVSVWHPDRFSSNPRLKQKAEEKLKEINEAYETLKWALESGQVDPQTEYDSKDKTEAFFEAGTETVLHMWSYLSKAIRLIVAEAKSELEREDTEKKRKLKD